MNKILNKNNIFINDRLIEHLERVFNKDILSIYTQKNLEDIRFAQGQQSVINHLKQMLNSDHANKY